VRSLPSNIRDITATQVEALAATIADLDDAALVSPTACAGWLAAHLLVHIRGAYQELATALAAAYGGGDELRRHLADTARVAAAASRNAPRGRFRTLGHILAAEDILAVWTVELVVHQLDLRQGTPTPEGIALTVWTLDGLTGGRVSAWDDCTYISKATGREPLTSADRDVLLERAVEFPAFG
jgi:hypothetical protein